MAWAFFFLLVHFLAGKRINNIPNLFLPNSVFLGIQNFQSSGLFEVYRLYFSGQFSSSWYQYPKVSLSRRCYHSYFISELFRLNIIIICISALAIKTQTWLGSVCCAGIAVTIHNQNKRQQKDKVKLQKQSNKKSITESELKCGSAEQSSIITLDSCLYYNSPCTNEHFKSV